MGIASRINGVVLSARAECRLRLPAKAKIQPVAAGVVVSLTTFPARANSVWIAVESILRQSVLPERVVIVLAEDEFKDIAVPSRLTRSGRVELLWVERNTRSYKKYIPVRRKYPDAVIVTADDDVMYPPRWLSDLLSAHEASPSHIIGTRGAEMLIDEDGRPGLYQDWPGATRTTPSNLVFLKGDGGILYPPGSLPAQALDEDLAIRLCPTTDDVWFRVMALLQGTPVRRSIDGPIDFPVIRRSQKVTLRRTNVAGGGNDAQIRAALAHFGLVGRLASSSTGQETAGTGDVALGVTQCPPE